MQATAFADQAESDYEDEDEDEPTKSSQDHDQYHGKGWRVKKAKGPSQTDTSVSTNAAMDHTPSTKDVGAGIEQQAIWNESVEAGSLEQPISSEQSSSTIYDQEASVTSRSACLKPCSPWTCLQTTSQHLTF